MSNVKHTIGCTFTQDASIHWLEVRMSSKKCPRHCFFWVEVEGLWSHHYGVKARILVVWFGC